MPDLERAIAIAVKAHRGQTDKVGGAYILHPLRVMFRMADETDMIVAVLHDVVEDCEGWSFARLRRNGFSEQVIAALQAVTKRPEEEDDYEAFIDRAAANPIARRVKLADLEDNLNVTRLPEIKGKDARRITKYLRARRRLLDATS